MNEYYFIIKHGWKLIGTFIPILLISIIILCSASSGGSEDGVATSTFQTPFDDKINYTITSNFGTRIDPINLDKISFHSGLDLAAPEGTPILASANGIVYETGYSPNGLGNYVYIEHNYGDLKLYTMYGHMLDNSVVVKKGQKVKAKEKIGTIGTTGRSTGIHLHFMISKNKISFKQEDLIDPLGIMNKKNPNFG